MQSGFCGDVKAAWCASQSEELFEPIRKYCSGRGKAFPACFSASTVADILGLGGDIFVYCSHWMRPLSHCCALLSQERSSVPFPQVKVATAKEYKQTCRACVLGRHNVFWPWGVFCRIDAKLENNVVALRGRTLGHMPVMLTRGDGAQGELEFLACACQQSFVFLAWFGCHVEVLLICALGCGVALKDGGSGISVHADEVPCICTSWLSSAFIWRVKFWRTCHRLLKTWPKRATMLIARCSTLKSATLEALLLQRNNLSEPINFVSWAEQHSMPHVFEPKRPSKSDPEDAITLSSWWYHYAKLRGFSMAIVTPIKQASPEPRSSVA